MRQFLLAATCLAFAGAGMMPSAMAESSSDLTASAQTSAPLQQLGTSSFYVSLFHVYDAELWTPESGFDWDQPFRLKLTYARKIKGEQLVQASLKEMARVFDRDVSAFEALRAPLSACFRDVRKGDVIEGVSAGRDAARFYYNGDQTCELDLPNASYEFFSIWLSKQSRSPKQTRRLLGLSRR